jgi:hypothetical protein
VYPTPDTLDNGDYVVIGVPPDEDPLQVEDNFLENDLQEDDFGTVDDDHSSSSMSETVTDDDDPSGVSDNDRDKIFEPVTPPSLHQLIELRSDISSSGTGNIFFKAVS